MELTSPPSFVHVAPPPRQRTYTEPSVKRIIKIAAKQKPPLPFVFYSDARSVRTGCTLLRDALTSTRTFSNDQGAIFSSS